MIATDRFDHDTPPRAASECCVPPSTHLQPIDMRVLDPDNATSAKIGLATQP